MQIPDTDLEYTEEDKIALDFFLGGKGEDLEQWGQRVVRLCNEHAETDGKGYDAKGMPEVYDYSAQELWANKIEKRREALADALGIDKGDTSDSAMRAIKGKVEYKTRAASEAEDAIKMESRRLSSEHERAIATAKADDEQYKAFKQRLIDEGFVSV